MAWVRPVRGQARLQALKATTSKTIQNAFREVADALAGVGTLAPQLQATQNQLESESTRLRLTNLRLENGAASQLELPGAQRTLFGVQQALVQTRLVYLQNQVVLFKTLGDGALRMAAHPACNLEVRLKSAVEQASQA